MLEHELNSPLDSHILCVALILINSHYFSLSISRIQQKIQQIITFIGQIEMRRLRMSRSQYQVKEFEKQHTYTQKEGLFRHEAYRGVGCTLTVKVPKTDPLQLRQTAVSDAASSPLCPSIPFLLPKRSASLQSKVNRQCCDFDARVRAHYGFPIPSMYMCYCVSESGMIDTRVTMHVKCTREQLGSLARQSGPTCAHFYRRYRVPKYPEDYDIHDESMESSSSNVRRRKKSGRRVFEGSIQDRYFLNEAVAGMITIFRKNCNFKQILHSLQGKYVTKEFVSNGRPVKF